jgi:signal transduction histidine kinase
LNGKILIVDDEPLNLDLLEALLIPEGYALERAGSVHEAIEKISVMEPDLILLDIMMPVRSGFDALKNIRENEKTRAIPVILLTSLYDMESRIKGIDAGADEFISKPFDKAELLSRVRTLTKLSILRRQINEKEKLLNVMELMGEGTAITDEKLDLKLINDTASEMIGLKDIHGNLKMFLEEKFNYTLDGGAPAGQFMIKRRKSEANNALFISSKFRRMAGLGGDTDSYVFVFRDVTEEYRRNKMKNDFLSLISHKLMTPMTVINGYSKILGVLIPDPVQKNVLDAMARNSSVMINLIQRILYFVEIENSFMEESVNLLDLPALTARFSALYEKPFELIDHTGRVRVPFWMKIAAEELVDNSFKFNDKAKLVLEVTAVNGGLKFEDNGPGIPSEERKKVFEPFYQVYKSFSGNTAGAGLGLSIVKKMCESNGYVIGVEPGDNEGLSAFIALKDGVKNDAESTVLSAGINGGAV